jgi:hypothetical protein
MRVLFLDFDGVAHSTVGSGVPVVHFQWLPVLVDLLEPWPDVNVAVHSTWRYVYDPRELMELLGPLGPRFIGSVPRGPRAESILWFLHLVPEIDSYLVLDDAPGEFPPDMTSALVVCDPMLGVSAPDVQARIKAWLAGGTP